MVLSARAGKQLEKVFFLRKVLGFKVFNIFLGFSYLLMYKEDQTQN